MSIIKAAMRRIVETKETNSSRSFDALVQVLIVVSLVAYALETLPNLSPTQANALLIEWHIQDPVDDTEIKRNNIIEKYQGNRNPFVDNPGFVEVVFQTDK